MTASADYPEFHRDDGDLDVAALIGTFWRLDGPHTPDTVTTAAAGVDELLHYLARATRDRGSMPTGPDVYRVVSELRSAMGRLDQVLDQVSRHAAALVSDPTLYDDRRDDRHPGETAQEVRDGLGAARYALGPLLDALTDAHNASGHLGHKS